MFELERIYIKYNKYVSVSIAHTFKRYPTSRLWYEVQRLVLLMVTYP